MPEERWEWVAFFVGIAVTVALLALIVLDRGSKTHGSRAAAATVPVAHTTTAPRPPGTTTHTSPTTTTAPGKTPPPPPPVRLRLTARKDTWLSVRRTSGGGGILYQGTLAAGSTRTFSGSSFQVRFGGAANVVATLNGKPLPLPGGTYSVTVGKGGLGARAA